MELFVCGIGSIAFAFFLSDYNPIDMYIIPVAICAALGAGAFVLGRYTDKISLKRPDNTNIFGFKIVQFFECDKVKWSLESAEREYFSGVTDLGTVSDDVSDKICEYAAMPIASYMCWLLRRDLVSDEFYAVASEDVVNAVREGRESPVTLLEHIGEVFTREMIDERAWSFTDIYYRNGSERFMPYSCDTVSYQFDYFDIVGGGRNYYVNDFSWEKQFALEELLDKRFAGYNDEDAPYDYPVFDGAYSELFGRELDVNAAECVSEDYIRACIAQIVRPDKALAEKICDRLNDFRDEYDEEPLKDRNEIFGLFKACLVYIYPPEGEELAYCVIGGGELEPEHGCGFTVKDGYVSAVGCADDVESPWTERFECERRLNDLTYEPTRQMSIIPYECGGSESSDNTVYAPAVIAEFKEKCDRRIICLLKQGSKLSYQCDPIYRDNRVLGVSVTATSDGRNIFDARIAAPY